MFSKSRAPVLEFVCQLGKRCLCILDRLSVQQRSNLSEDWQRLRHLIILSLFLLRLMDGILVLNITVYENYFYFVSCLDWGGCIEEGETNDR